VKGLEFALQLAREMPDEKFRFAGNWQADTPKNLHPNIHYQARQDQISNLFESTKVVIMPSQWQEAFGRLPLEAMAAGVPVITSDRGNLRETVGAGGQVLELDLRLWIKAIGRIEDERPKWKQAGHQRVRDYRQSASKIWNEYFGPRK